MPTKKSIIRRRFKSLVNWSEQITRWERSGCDWSKEITKLENKIEEKNEELMELLPNTNGYASSSEVMEMLGTTEYTGYEWMLGNGDWC